MKAFYQERYFETDKEYCKIILAHDLLGDLILMTFSGRKSTQLNGICKTVYAPSALEAQKQIEQISKRLIKRDFQEINLNIPTINSLKTTRKLKTPITKSFKKKTDLLDPKLFVTLLKQCRNELSDLFNNKQISFTALHQAIQKQFPEYSAAVVRQFLKQWATFTIYKGSLVNEEA